MASQTLYILYNADASIMGKLTYGYRKITCSKDADPTCAACDITHGGLSLKETPAWTEVKKEIEGAGLKVVQWHRDELSSELKTWIEENKVPYPMAIIQKEGGGFEEVIDRDDLATLKGDSKAFLEKLKSKGVVAGSQ